MKTTKEYTKINHGNIDEKGTRRGTGRAEVVFILDRSGSMGGLEADTIGGFNSMLARQKAEGGDILWSTVLFDHLTEVVHDRCRIGDVSPLDEKTYYVRGCTALLDAVGGAIRHIERAHHYAPAGERPDRTIIVITTDGYENASEKFTASQVKEMIRGKESQGWEFVFLGANMDAVETAEHIGIRPERAATFHNDGAGIAENYRALGKALRSVSLGEALEEGFLDSVRKDYASRK